VVSEKVMEVYSPSILKLVRDLCPAPSHPPGHNYVLVGSWCEQLARESMQRVQRNREQAEHAAHTNF
jgi:hypothetical protein